MPNIQKAQGAVLGGGVWILSRMGAGLPPGRVISGVAAELDLVQKRGVDAWGQFGGGFIESPDPNNALSVVSRIRRPALFRRVIRFCRTERRGAFLRTAAAQARKSANAISAERRGELLRAAGRLESAAQTGDFAGRDLRECLMAVFAAEADGIADLVFGNDDEASAVVGENTASLFASLSPAAGCAVNFCNLVWWKPEYGVPTIASDSFLRKEARDARKTGDDLYLVRAPFTCPH